MKLKRFYIKDWRNLKDFEINFENTTEHINVLIGVNGSGKSNLIEAIVSVFKYIYLGNDKPEFDFELSYTTKAKDVLITGNRDDGCCIRYDGEELTQFRNSMIAKEYGNDVIIPNIVLFYSGTNKRLAQAIERCEEKFAKSLKQGELARRPFYYVRDIYYPFILLSLLSSQLDEIKNFFKDKFCIEKLQGFEIVINNQYKRVGKKVGKFAKKLFNEVLTVKTMEADKTLLMFGDGEESINRMREWAGDEGDILEYLDMAYFSGLIEDIRVYVKKANSETIISHDMLSEGEQQLITLKGLAEFFKYKETLYLFDEPDTYLHPKWQRELIDEIKAFDVKHQFIITTHSPNILTTMKRENVFIIEDGKVVEETPYTLGRDINSILFELMGVTKRPEQVQQQIDRFYSLIRQKQIEQAQEQLNNLMKFMGEDDAEIVKAKTRLNFERD